MARYSFTCPCDKLIPVETSAAGSEIVCACGSKTAVPKLSQLRVMAGEGAYEAGTVDTILRMLDEGKLPWGETCAISGQRTTDRIEVYVECEKLHFKDARNDRAWVAIFVSTLVALFMDPEIEEDEPQGRETRVRTPLRVARDQHATVSRMSQRRLRRLLRQVPIYDKLLKDYPMAEIVVGDLPMETDLKLDPGFAR